MKNDPTTEQPETQTPAQPGSADADFEQEVESILGGDTSEVDSDDDLDDGDDALPDQDDGSDDDNG